MSGAMNTGPREWDAETYDAWLARIAAAGDADDAPDPPDGEG